MIAPNDRPLPLSPEHIRFLNERFRRVEREKAAPGHRGRYAVVRQDGALLGLVAVDGNLGIWYSACVEDEAELRRQGFSYSRADVLASLYFALPFAAAAPPRAAASLRAAALPTAAASPQAAAAPQQETAAPSPLLHLPRLHVPVSAAAGARRASGTKRRGG